MPRKVVIRQAPKLANLPPETQDKIRKWFQLQQEYETAHAEFEMKFGQIGKDVDALYKEIDQVLGATEEKKARVDDMIITYAGFERTSVAYGQVFNQALQRVTEEDRKILEELKKASTSVGHTPKLKIDILPAGSPTPAESVLREAWWQKLWDIVKGIASKIRSYFSGYDSAIKDLEKAVAMAQESVAEAKGTVLPDEVKDYYIDLGWKLLDLNVRQDYYDEDTYYVYAGPDVHRWMFDFDDQQWVRESVSEAVSLADISFNVLSRAHPIVAKASTLDPTSFAEFKVRFQAAPTDVRNAVRKMIQARKEAGALVNPEADAVIEAVASVAAAGGTTLGWAPAWPFIAYEWLDSLTSKGEDPFGASELVSRLASEFKVSPAEARDAYETWRRERGIETRQAPKNTLADRILKGEDPRKALTEGDSGVWTQTQKGWATEISNLQLRYPKQPILLPTFDRAYRNVSPPEGFSLDQFRASKDSEGDITHWTLVVDGIEFVIFND